MGVIIIDRRKNPSGKSLDNAHRFTKRYRKRISRAVGRSIADADIEDIAKEEEKKIKVKEHRINEPEFVYGSSYGKTTAVFSGNKKFVVGDRIPKKQQRQKDGGAGLEGESLDDFSFVLSGDEWREIVLEGLELPEMIKKAIIGEDSETLSRSGFAQEGNPSSLDLLRTFRNSKGRKIALRMPKRKKKKALQAEKEELQKQLKQINDNQHKQKIESRIEEIDKELEILEKQLKAIGRLDPVDVRYRRYERSPAPIAQAVMFCLMDVSGSMGENEKSTAKLFFMLLYLFLTRNYDKVELVFIRHHHIAKEVDQEEFFHSKESGGTLASSALKLMLEIIEQRYDLNSWNVYGCQASDGDNYYEDYHDTLVAMDKVLGFSQYFAYVEIGEMVGSIWETYQEIVDYYDNLSMARVDDRTQIYPVFRSLFEKGKQKRRVVHE